jgi:PAS domain S-box-containing protein/diguanylate cyclase (GGDEF)-like protein
MLDLRLLVVEDDERLLKRLERILKREVKELFIFSNPLEAIEKISEIKPDIVITDIKMPQMNGLEMTSQIRAVCKDIPIIVASAFSDPEYFQSAIKLKVEKFIIKPIDIDELLLTLKNVTNSLQLDRMYKEKNKLLNEYKEIVDQSAYVSKTDINGNITYVNDKFIELSGYTQEELIGKNHNILRDPSMPRSFFERMWHTILNKQIWQGVIKNRNKKGESFYVETTISPILDINNEIIEFISIKNDVTDLIKNKQLLQNQIVTDALTMIPNRLKLKSDLARINQPTLILVDIDGFQEINNLFGFYFGDQTLVHLSQLLSNLAQGDGASCYRVSADEFAILYFEHIEKQQIDAFINSIIKKVKNEPFSFNGIKLDIDLSFGVSITNNNEKNMILALAEAAMNNARKNGTLYEVYSQSIDPQARYEHNFKWNKKLKSALDDNRIDVYYQPIVNIKDSEEKKYEALVRYIEKDGTVITPYEFLNVAKRTRLYHEITKRVIEVSCKTFSKLKGSFSINFSIEDFYNVETVDYLILMVEKYNLKDRVFIEILESEGIDNYNYTIEVIERMKSNGIKIAIDDFGTGYSNFAYLISLDIDILKIDGSLIRGVAKDKAKQTILEAIIFFSKELHIKTIAEFVSDEETYEKVKELNIDYVQGYYLDKPLSYEDLLKKTDAEK